MDFIILMSYFVAMLVASFIVFKILHFIFGDFDGTYGGH
mgnify:CR=1 FL=1